jgi:hypothetical protein
MPQTYLLLRNNKQSGPHSLEELLQLSLKQHDLIWVEGHSAGWRTPAEIDVLKPYLPGQKTEESTRPLPTAPATRNTPTERSVNPGALNRASHIYVSLPAGVVRRSAEVEAQPAPASLEEKAEALHQRMKAYAEGRPVEEDPDTRYARSLDDMKQEYGAWLVKQQLKKKKGISKRMLIVAGSVVVITTTSYGISKWISHKSAVQQPPVNEYEVRPVKEAEPKSIATVTFAGKDSFTSTTTEVPFLQKDPVRNEAAPLKKETKQTSTPKKGNETPQKDPAPAMVDSTTTTPESLPSPKEEKKAPEVPKKVVALSRLVGVSGTLPHENQTGATTVTLQNNSSEVLKSVAVTITYFKKNERPAGKETVYFFDVPPASAPVITISGNRKAASARFQIGTITRADGSLYLIH